MKITFLKDEVYETEGPNKGPTYLKGKTYEVRDDFGNRWIHRKVAVLADDGAKVEKGPRPYNAPAEAAPAPQAPAPTALSKEEAEAAEKKRLEDEAAAADAAKNPLKKSNLDQSKVLTSTDLSGGKK